MYTFLTRNGQSIAFGVGLVMTIVMVALIFAGLSDFEAFGDGAGRYDTTIFNFGMYAAIALVILGLIAAVVFGIVQLASDPKGAIKGIAGLVAIVAIFFIFYSIADPNNAMLARLSDFSVSVGQSKFISGSITTALILLAAAVVAGIVSEIINLFK